MIHFLFHHRRGMTTVLVLVFGAVFGMLVSSLAGIVIGQAKLSRVTVAREQALHIAEAGIQYYSWFLGRFPTDVQDGTGTSGPYVHTYTDSAGGILGEFSIDVSGNLACGQVQSVDIVSTGHVDTHPAYTRTISARRMKPTVAEYAQVFGDGVWFGATSNTVGVIHANGGVRMDGVHNSLVQSTASTWTCTSSYGCSPDSAQNGVFGSGGPASLWQYPVPSLNFTDMGSDALATKSLAQSSGIYLSAFSGNSDAKGYRLLFQSNGTVSVYRVNNSTAVWAYSSTYGYTYSTSFNWRQVRDVITNQTYIGNYTIPTGCSLIFSEEKLWMEGVVNGRVAVVAYNSGSYNPDVLLTGNITYAGEAGEDSLSVVAENYILFPHNGPENHTIYGIYTAVKGRFGRDYYTSTYVGSAHALKDSLTIVGTVVSYGRPSVYWSCGGSPCSGFLARNYYYDSALIPNPPPFTPTVSDMYRFYLWREE